jgi:hypothetical protein
MSARRSTGWQSAQHVRAALDALSRQRRNKYGAKPVMIDGVMYHSEGEYRRWCELVALQQSGSISNLARQVRVELVAYGLNHEPARLGRKGRYYIADFAYETPHGYQLEDYKGFDTPMSQLKREMVEAQTGRPVLLTRNVGRRSRGDVSTGVSAALIRRAAPRSNTKRDTEGEG